MLVVTCNVAQRVAEEAATKSREGVMPFAKGFILSSVPTPVLTTSTPIMGDD
jgi:hypothetical protein